MTFKLIDIKVSFSCLNQQLIVARAQSKGPINLVQSPLSLTGFRENVRISGEGLNLQLEMLKIRMINMTRGERGRGI